MNVSQEFLEAQKEPGARNVDNSCMLRLDWCRGKHAEEKRESGNREKIAVLYLVYPQMSPQEDQEDYIQADHVVHINSSQPTLFDCKEEGVKGITCKRNCPHDAFRNHPS